jgi:hypothetical protein
MCIPLCSRAPLLTTSCASTETTTYAWEAKRNMKSGNATATCRFFAVLLVLVLIGLVSVVPLALADGGSGEPDPPFPGPPGDDEGTSSNSGQSLVLDPVLMVTIWQVLL